MLNAKDCEFDSSTVHTKARRTARPPVELVRSGTLRVGLFEQRDLRFVALGEYGNPSSRLELNWHARCSTLVIGTLSGGYECLGYRGQDLEARTMDGS